MYRVGIDVGTTLADVSRQSCEIAVLELTRPGAVRCRAKGFRVVAQKSVPVRQSCQLRLCGCYYRYATAYSSRVDMGSAHTHADGESGETA